MPLSKVFLQSAGQTTW